MNILIFLTLCIVNGNGKCVSAGNYGMELNLRDNWFGFIRSNDLIGFSKPYSNNLNYKLTLKNPNNLFVMAHENMECWWDTLKIGTEERCGYRNGNVVKQTHRFNSPGSIDVNFRSDGSVQDNGFGVIWNTEAPSFNSYEYWVYYDEYELSQYHTRYAYANLGAQVPGTQVNQVSLVGYENNKEYYWIFAAGNDQEICVEMTSYRVASLK